MLIISHPSHWGLGEGEESQLGIEEIWSLENCWMGAVGRGYVCECEILEMLPIVDEIKEQR